ncbi:hypothetical protein WN944_015423 [Citrus x changshan-huyou]|uniref:NAD-dependent epimerase/dehydratase domain-containing protein n=1 Tax=Citrus x changshan-huyou TaxID=2935761 RepID=A0AAP0QLS1_9ROSI
MDQKSNFKVCVTGGEGFVGSWLIKKLLDKGYIVHTTLRPNLEDKSKVDLLKSLPGAETRLIFFEAEIYDPDTFENAIQGCDFVFHVATPLQHIEGYQYENVVEACVGAAKKIASFCVKSGTVKRLVYTASVLCASPIKEDASAGYKDSIDETCYTPLDHPLTCHNEYLRVYIESKMKSEKELLSYGSSGLEVVALALGVVAGDTNLPYSSTPVSVIGGLCQLTNNEYVYQTLRDTEEILGKLPLVHIDDVCEAHIFCMEKPSMTGRFFCTNIFVSSAEIASCLQQNYPEFHIKQEYLDVPKREIKWGGTKLEEKGFEYKYDLKMILDDSIKCGRKTGYLPQ